MMVKLKNVTFQKPVIIAANLEDPFKRKQLLLEECSSHCAGKFIAIASGNKVGVYALTYTKSLNSRPYVAHEELGLFLRALGNEVLRGIVLGGGEVYVDSQSRSITFCEDSREFGNVPLSILQGALSLFDLPGWRVDIEGAIESKYGFSPTQNSSRVREWCDLHGVPM